MSETFFYNADISKGNFTILDNTCIRDRRLSLKAKGLHTYFMSLPRDWKLYKSELVNHFKDGIDSVNSAIKENTTTVNASNVGDMVANLMAQFNNVNQ